jgi:hypothetical protein
LAVPAAGGPSWAARAGHIRRPGYQLAHPEPLGGNPGLIQLLPGPQSVTGSAARQQRLGIVVAATRKQRLGIHARMSLDGGLEMEGRVLPAGHGQGE